ncbi:hypothetical protein [Desulfoplanes formicivorans]|uniref:Uncharacterized protein n=1 Tax=Desulfoplanes formicivorans TaxID=1592317 RepID=A0A194AM80_9BACT|nr:hypothetical protein [Desulfoplanes formicivorans]GAU09754.1 hypothetical protein DPF_2486 [Desulfoplanes formicivorans]
MENATEFWETGIQYINLTQSVSRKIVEKNNANFMISDEEFIGDDFFEATRWSDYRLSIPLIFNLYHGLELLLKGFLYASG